MAEWRIQLFGSPLVLKDGRPVTLRTRHQALLLAALAAHRDRTIVREKTAERLWPEANRDNGLAYLRRALKELRDVGLDIRTDGPNLRLAAGISTDIDDLRAWSRPFPSASLLPGLDGPLVHEIRESLRLELGAPPVVASTPLGSSADAELFATLGRALVRKDPSAAVTLFLEEWPSIGHCVPIEPLLALSQELLKSIAEEDPRRPNLLMHIAWSAYMVTRLGLARQLWLEVLEKADLIEDNSVAARALLHLVNVETDEHRWAEARAYAERAVEITRRFGDRTRLAGALHNRGRLRWRTLDLAGAIEDYQSCFRLVEGTDDEHRLGPSVRMILTFIRAGLGQAVGPLPPAHPSEASEPNSGYRALLVTSIRFWTAFECGDRRAAVAAGIARMEVSAREGMERDFVYSLEAVACLFGRLGHGHEGAACLRLASRVRRQLGARRAPAEDFLLRRHLPPPYFGSEIARLT